MNLEQMKIEYDQAKADYSLVNSQTARAGISEELRKLRKNIEDEEHRINSKLRIVKIDGENFDLPAAFNWYKEERYDLEVKDGVLYVYEKLKKSEDGSFNINCYAWIPQKENKYVKLNIHILGGDKYGERYFLGATYYKHPADQYAYMEKGVRTDNYGYKPYYTYVIDKLGLKQKKDNRETNHLVWKEKKEA